MKNIIVIEDWTGKNLYTGNYKSKKVDRILDANRCKHCDGHGIKQDDTDCKNCNGTGYEGDFEVYWQDESDDRNVYEFINY